MATQPFISGKDSVLRIFSNGAEVILNPKTWNAGPNVTKVSDGVNGEDRDRLQSIINNFDFDCNGYIDSMKQVDALLAFIATNDAQVLPFDVAAALSFKILDGSKKAYVGKEVTLDDWKIQQGGRTERVMFSLNFRGRYFDAIPTI